MCSLRVNESRLDVRVPEGTVGKSLVETEGEKEGISREEGAVTTSSDPKLASFAHDHHCINHVPPDDLSVRSESFPLHDLRKNPLQRVLHAPRVEPFPLRPIHRDTFHAHALY